LSWVDKAEGQYDFYVIATTIGGNKFALEVNLDVLCDADSQTVTLVDADAQDYEFWRGQGVVEVLADADV